MRARGRLWAALISLMIVAGCGFRPVYAPPGEAAAQPTAELGRIRVARIPDRAGQIVRQELQRRLDQGDGLGKRYELAVGLSIAADAMNIQRDSTVTRLRLVGTANWSLKSLDGPQALITSGTARSLDGVNVLDQQYFEADLASETSQRRIAANLADQITLQLASFFAGRSGAG